MTGASDGAPLLVDTHCHLELIEEAGEGELDAAVAGAREAGVSALINIGLGEDNDNVVGTAESHEGVYAAVGWHPHQKRPPAEAELEHIAALAARPRVVAIGEVGLDYFWRPGYHEVPADIQKESFRLMLGVARRAGVPAMVHNREAHADTMTVLADFADVPVVMHAFSGDTAFAQRCVAAGVNVSVAGPVTYPGAGALREALAVVPLDRLLVETDAPFLPPQPWRGKPSRPAMVVETARALATLKEVSLAELSAQLEVNVNRIFGISVRSG